MILVQPVLGGAGAAHWLYNSVHIEAVLANPVAELPEVVRLGWLLAQLNFDLPMFVGDLLRESACAWWAAGTGPAGAGGGAAKSSSRGSTSATLSMALAAWRLPTVDPPCCCAGGRPIRPAGPPWRVASARARIACWRMMSRRRRPP